MCVCVCVRVCVSVHVCVCVCFCQTSVKVAIDIVINFINVFDSLRQVCLTQGDLKANSNHQLIHNSFKYSLEHLQDVG